MVFLYKIGMSLPFCFYLSVKMVTVIGVGKSEFNKIRTFTKNEGMLFRKTTSLCENGKAKKIKNEVNLCEFFSRSSTGNKMSPLI
jgi:hypothetical protein